MWLQISKALCICKMEANWVPSISLVPKTVTIKEEIIRITPKSWMLMVIWLPKPWVFKLYKHRYWAQFTAPRVTSWGTRILTTPHQQVSIKYLRTRRNQHRRMCSHRTNHSSRSKTRLKAKQVAKRTLSFLNPIQSSPNHATTRTQS